ncbi:rhodanese domain-containing protein [Tolypothrix sp. NIES-4075]|nr:rhodanese domain-containing protein [Tolypothrix sp. NIES-4075]
MSKKKKYCLIILIQYLTLEEAGISALNYFGSWNEWSRDFSLPIDTRVMQ